MHPHPAALMAIVFSADGQTVLCGDKDGLVAVSRPRMGMTFYVLSDHRGAPISTIQSANKEFREFGLRWRAWPWGWLPVGTSGFSVVFHRPFIVCVYNSVNCFSI